MTTLTIVLTSYGNYSVEYDRDKLRKLSAFVNGTLEMDTKTSTLELSTKDVTPSALDTLSSIIKTDKLPTTVREAPDVYLKAFRYLQVDVLEALADPTYPLFRELHPEIDLLDIKSLSDPSVYQMIQDFARKAGSTHLIGYLYSQTPSQGDIDTASFQRACNAGFIEQVQYGLRRLKTFRLTKKEHPLGEAIIGMRLDVAKLLIEDDRIDFDTDCDLSLLQATIDTQYYPMIKLILGSPKLSPGEVNKGLEGALVDPCILKMLLTYPGIDVSTDGYKALQEAYDTTNPKCFHLLLYHPRTKFIPAIKAVFGSRPHKSITDMMLEKQFRKVSVDIFKSILTHPKVQIEELPDPFFYSIMSSSAGLEYMINTYKLTQNTLRNMYSYTTQCGNKEAYDILTKKYGGHFSPFVFLNWSI